MENDFMLFVINYNVIFKDAIDGWREVCFEKILYTVFRL